MATFIDGIAASENIDSSGERISIAGMDISSLAIDGVFTYEHEAGTDAEGKKITVKLPAQTVGKILKAKKIFSEDDCEDDRQEYFWKKCQTPYIYIMGELFDDYTDAARDLAGKFRYDNDRLSQNERTVCNFSIEGAYIAKEGIEVTRSVARKCTITVLPCNKAARAEMVPSKDSKGKNDIESLFKTEPLEIELFKTERPLNIVPTPKSDMQKHADILGLEPMSKNVLPFQKPLTSAPGVGIKPAPTAPAPGVAPKLPGSTNNAGRHIGSTKSGKSVMSHAKIHEYHNMSSHDHADAANLHHGAAQAATDPKTGAHHLDKMKLHLQAAKTSEQREGRFARGKAAGSTLGNSMHKTLEAGSGMAAPGNLTGGAALAKEDLKKGISGHEKGVHLPTGDKRNPGTSTMGTHVRKPTPGYSKEAAKIHASVTLREMKNIKPKLDKGEWLARAEEAYSQWDKKDEFKSFMKDRMPNLAEGEIDALGRTIALKKSLEAEQALSKLIKK